MSPEADIDENIRERVPVDFIYNDGSAAHRGVWHVTDNLVVTQHPAEQRPFFGGAAGYFDNPAYETATGDAICGQRDRIKTGRMGYFYSDWKKPVVDGKRVVRGRPERAMYLRDSADRPPMPLCSRCAKKAGVDY